MPSDAMWRLLNALHSTTLKLSGGRIGGRVCGMPMLELTTTGRKTGQPRTVMLSSPLQEGSTIVIVASRGGDDRNPTWFLNLRDNPAVQVALQGQPPRPMKAHVATPEERARLWPKVIADHKNYAGYQKKTAREIPLVLLEPAG